MTFEEFLEDLDVHDGLVMAHYGERCYVYEDDDLDCIDVEIASKRVESYEIIKLGRRSGGYIADVNLED